MIEGGMSDSRSKQGFADRAAPAQESQGHAERITRLFRDHNQALIRFLALRLRSQQEAREVAQEAYVRLLQLGRPGAVSFLRALLFKIAANLAVDRIRHEQTVRRCAREGSLTEEWALPPTPERAAHSAQELQLVQRLIDELPPKCRQAFLLHRLQGLAFPEVARRMGLGERMVRTYVVRAVLYCRAGLEAAGTVTGEDPHG
jgi:RNA polymerase sigma factor (sigma-70 family)